MRTTARFAATVKRFDIDHGRAVLSAAGLLCLVLVVTLTQSPPRAGAVASYPGQGFLPHDRAWEMVSPPDKNGGDVMAFSSRTRAAADGDAVGFASLAGFAGVDGGGVAAEYIAERTRQPGTNGWSTHGITPAISNSSYFALSGGIDAIYDGELSPDLDRGVFLAPKPLTGDEDVKDVPNLYSIGGLRSSEPTDFDLVTACPRCATAGPLPPPGGLDLDARFARPAFLGASSDFERIVFESHLNLTDDAPAQSPLCGPEHIVFPPFAFMCVPRAYEWANGTVSLAGILPDGTPADVSVPGSGTIRGTSYSARAISDGSDGHSRVFFTQLTNEEGLTFSQLEPEAQMSLLGANSSGKGFAGNLFMRVDGTPTVKLNASERAVEDEFAPARIWGVSDDGRRVFFMTSQDLTEDADELPAVRAKLYMYDASKPDSAPDNLTLVTPDTEPADGDPGGEIRGLLGMSSDGTVVYIAAQGQLVEGGPTDPFVTRIYVWKNGDLSEAASTGMSGLSDGNLVLEQYGRFPRETRVTPDGQFLIFSLQSKESPTGYDHGVSCVENGSVGPCRELYVYSAARDEVLCASCNPSGAPATATASNQVDANHAGARPTTYQNHALSDDGRFVFFSTAERLVPGDTNSVSDAYVYDTGSREPRLLSSGRDAAPSYFVEASPDGADAFFVTRQPLSGWDVDRGYDLYDARIDGGLPEPPPAPPACVGDACQPAPVPLNDATPASSGFAGPGNPRIDRRPCRAGRHGQGGQKGKKPCRKSVKRHKRNANNDGGQSK